MHPLSLATPMKKSLSKLLALLATLVAFPLLATAAQEINVTGNSVGIPDGKATPGLADHTDFGNVLVAGGTLVRTFTIQNLGDANLNLTGTPKVAVTGSHAGDYTVTAVPASPVAAAGSTTFQVTFNPSTSGLRTATLTIINDDSDEGIYDFAVHGNGLVEPEINVVGNSVSIADGDATPGTADHTDFGSALVTGATVVRTFTIQNLGDASLTLSGTPKVVVSGTHAADFTVTALPTSPVVAGGSTTFQITFNPSASGTRTATLTIPNDDTDEATYDFAIQGFGVNNVPTATTFGTILVTSLTTGTVTDRFVVGTNISGLTYAPEDHGYAATQFYTFLKATNGTSSFDTITASTGATVDRFDATTRTFDGLTYAAANLGYDPLRFYAVSHNTAGVSTFSTVAPGGVVGVITDLFVLGTNFDAITFASTDVGFGANLFYYVRHDSTGLSTFGTITPGGTVTDRFTVGFNVDALVFTDLTAPGFGANNFYYLRHDASGESTFGTIFVTGLTSGTVTDRFSVGSHASELTFTATDVSFGANLFYFLRGRVTNIAPTLAAIANPAAILEDAALQTVNLSGIRAGGIESQALTVTATSANTSLIPNPTVIYTSANAFGSLTYTPVANASGTAVITVVVTDDGGTDNGGVNAVTNTFTVTVTTVNDAPTDITLTGGRVLDAAAINSSAGTFTATDVDVGDTHTFTLVAGTGDTHNSRFTIDGNVLKLAVAAALADSSYSIRVRATDVPGGATFEKVFTVLVMAVLVDTGDYLIADRGPYRNTGVILAVTKIGSVQRILSTQLKDPHDIAVDAAGDFIVSDYDFDPTGFGAGRGSSLFKIHRQTGVHTRLVFGAPLVTPLSVKVESDGKLLVADADFGFGPGVTSAGAVFRIVPGVSTNTLSSLNNFYFLQGLALATNGDIYVSDFGNGGGRPTRVIKVDKTTGAQTVITTGGQTRPVGLAVETDGLSLIVVDAIAKKLIRVSLPAGTQTQVSADAQFIQPTHVAIEADGSYIVTDGKASGTAGERRLYRVNRTTGVATILTSDGFFQQPRGVTLAQ